MRKVIIAGMIGNGLEWYDYALYGHFAALISLHFFPKGDEYVALIATFGVFAAGFAMRPVGAILFGYLGDRYGRKLSLTASILLMAVPTACIGLLPTYTEIGIVAPILLTVIRLLQGLALGGELSGSITYVVEHAPDGRRGLAGSTSMVSMMCGILLGAATASLMAEILPEEDFKDWGWRIPFIAGLGIGLVGFYIRRFLDESPAFTDAKEQGHLSDTPFRETLRCHWRPLLTAIGMYMAVTVPFYTLMVFMNSFLSKVEGYPLDQAILSNTGAMFVTLLCIPVGAHISDKIGRKPVMVTAAIGFVLLTLPAFWLIDTHRIEYALLGQVILAVLVGFYISPVAALLVEIFPTSVRYTGMALACNVAAAVFGGTAPAVITWLVQTTGENTVAGVYVIASALASLIALKFYRETYKLPLASTN